MLQILRNKAQSTVIQVIVVIIALVFIFWGVGTNIMNSRESAITVNGEEISFQDYQTAYDRTYQNIAAQFGGTLPKGLDESLGIKQQVIKQLVQSALLRQGAGKMGIIISEEEVQNTITTMPQFQESGGFSMEKYQSLLSANRLTPHKFETNMRFDMLSEKTMRDIGRFASLGSDYEVEELYRQDNEKVSVTYTKISPAQFISGITADEKELAKWFEGAKENYRGEPLMKLKYLDFSFAEVGEKIAIDEARIKSYYEENSAEFTEPEKRRARHILIQTTPGDSEEVLKEKKQRAEDILKLARSQQDFAALAKQYSEDPGKANGGDLGVFAKGQMVPAFEEAVFAMKPGEISEVITTSFGYHVIKLEEIQPSTTQSLSEAHDKILASLQNTEAQSLAFQMANSAYEGIISSGSLQAYADNTPGQQIIQTDLFPRSNPPAGLAKDQEFLTQAFALKAGELSSLIKTAAGYYIVFAEEVQAPETPTLDKVRVEATADFIAEMAARKAEKTAADVLTRIRAGEDFGAVIGETGLTMNDSGFMGLTGSENSAFPQSLVPQIFLLSKSEPYPESPGKVDEDHYVFSFQERQIPEAGSKEDLEKYRQLLLREKQQELLSAYISNLEKVAKITVHSSL